MQGERAAPAKKHQCPVCGLSVAKLQLHMLTHTVKKSHECTVCGQKFFTKGSLNYHLLSHPNANRTSCFECKTCKQKFSSDDLLKLHVAIQSKNRLHGHGKKLDLLVKPSSDVVKQHRETHIVIEDDVSEESAHKCSLCGQGFITKELLDSHVPIHDGKYPHECGTCKDMFFTVADLNSHINLKHSQRSYSSSKFSQPIYLRSHMQIHATDLRNEYRENKWNSAKPPDGKNFQCRTCKEIYVSARLLAAHELIHTQRPVATKEDLATRILSHSSVQKDLTLKCLTCKKQFPTLESIRAHITVTHTAGRKSYKCRRCGKSFPTERNLNCHIMSRHPREEQERLPSASHLASHQLLHVQNTSQGPTIACPQKPPSTETASKPPVLIYIRDEMFQCTVCDRQFLSKVNLGLHTLAHAAGQKPSKGRRRSLVRVPEKPQVPQVTAISKKKLPIAKSASPQVLTYTGEKPRTVCKEIFATEDPLACTTSPPPGTREKSHECTVCGKRFFSKVNLDFHMMLHDGEDKEGNAKDKNCKEPPRPLEQDRFLPEDKPADKETYPCEICERHFHSKGNLNYHRTIHNGQNLHPCPICHRKLLKKSALAQHMKSHRAERPFKCSICTVATATAKGLEHHMKTAHEDQLFKCSDCGEQFTSKASLEAHKADCGKPTFHSTICEKVFASEARMRFHMTTHEAGQECCCTICGQEFPTLGHLNGHMKRRKLKCTICDMRYCAKVDLEKHSLVHDFEFYQ